ncbi:MAG: TonB family protein [Deltaproteobacteria bacterium]|nr:MAG: TonB family protein [Deltaproteobacteria bacterium]
MHALLLTAALLPLLLQIEEQPARTEAEHAAESAAPVLTKAPELIHFVDAEYPEAAKAEGVEGEVVLTLTLDETGRVTDVAVTRPLHPLLDAAAVAAARQLRFTPAEVNGKPAPVQIEFRYVFTFRPPEPPPGTDEAKAPAEATLQGEVLVRGRRDPIEGAIVRSGEAVAETDAEGRFELRLPEGRHPIEVRAPGFEPFRTHEVVTPGTRTEVRYYLLRSGKSPFEIVVRGEREKKEVSRVVLQREELTKVPGTFGDPLRVLENLPGMQRAPFIGGQLLVRGASPEDSGVYFDGVEIPILYHFGGLTSVVNPEFLEEIDFQPGGFGARYGRATAGIVEVESRRHSGKLARGSLKVDLADTSLFFRYPITDDLSVAAAGRRSYVDLFLPLVIGLTSGGGSGGSGLVTLAPQYGDYQVKVDYDGLPDHALSLFLFGSNDTFEILTTGAARQRAFGFDLRIGFHRLTLTDTWKISDALTARTLGFIGLTTQGAAGGEVGGGFDFDFSFDRYEAGFRHDLEYRYDENTVFRAGLDLYGLQGLAVARVPIDGDLLAFPTPLSPAPPPQDLDIEGGGSGLAFYAETTFKPRPNLTVTPGLRSELYVFNTYLHPTFDPRLALRWTVRDGTTLKAAAGHYHQAPSIFQVNELTGNPRLGPEAANHWILGIEQQITELIDLDVQAFYNARFDLAVPSNEAHIEDGRAVAERFANEGIGRAYGIELLLRHALTEDFFGWIAYTLMRSEVNDGGPGDPWILTDYDQTHILTVVGSYRLGGGFEAGARFRLVTGNPYTPVVGATHDLDADTWRPIRGAVHSARLPTFHQLDLRIEYTHVFDLGTLSFFLDLLNAYNQPNVEDFQYDYRYRAQEPFNGLPLFPVLGMRGAF